MQNSKRNNEILFSIITISLNTLGELRNTVKSVLNQKYKNYELIVIDGGSIDGSVSYLNNYSEKINWISEPDSGRYNAMNKGITLAHGKYLLFLNSGDTLANDNVLSDASRYINNESIYIGRLLAKNYNSGEITVVDLKDIDIDQKLLINYALPHQATFFKKNVFEKYGKFDEDYRICSDHDYFARMIKNKVKMTCIPVDISVFDNNGISHNPDNIERIKEEKSKIYEKNFGYPTIHFSMLALNVEVFLPYHIEIFKRLPIKWHWHIIEGLAQLNHDTSWSLENGATLPTSFQKDGRSIDRTSEIIDRLKKEYPDQITVYRKPLGELWDGKIEMVNAPLENIKEPAILWQIDCDEFWTYEQIIRLRDLFIKYPEKTAAYFMANTFVGKNLILASVNTYGNTLSQEWLRVWRYEPGDKWVAHEPPMLYRTTQSNELVNIAHLNPFTQLETESHGLVFQHYSYVTDAQVKFKEDYYGYPGALEKWKKMQTVKTTPFYYREYCDWVRDETIISSTQDLGIKPILNMDSDGKWTYSYEKRELPKMNSIRNQLVSAVLTEYAQKQNIQNEELNVLRPMNQYLRTYLDSIESSKGWRLLLLSRIMLNKAFPINGKLRKLISKTYSFGRKVFRKLRHRNT